MNKFKDAIDNDLTKQFLLGRGKYFVINRDWGGHDCTDTYLEIKEYLKEYGEEIGYKKLNDFLEKILASEFLSTYDLIQIIGLFRACFTYYSDGELNNKWQVSIVIKNQLKNQLNKHLEYNSDLRGINQNLDFLDRKYDFRL